MPNGAEQRQTAPFGGKWHRLAPIGAERHSDGLRSQKIHETLKLKTRYVITSTQIAASHSCSEKQCFLIVGPNVFLKNQKNPNFCADTSTGRLIDVSTRQLVDAPGQARRHAERRHVCINASTRQRVNLKY